MVKLNQLSCTLLFMMFLTPASWAQEHVEIKWLGPRLDNSFEGKSFTYLDFSGAAHDFSVDRLPRLILRKEVSGNVSQVQPKISNIQSSRLSSDEIAALGDIKSSSSYLNVSSRIFENRGRYFAEVTLVPLVNKGQLEKITSFDISFESSTAANSRSSRNSWKGASVLSGGNWIKIGVSKSQIYKLDYDFLSKAGVNLKNVDFRNVRIYGNGGGVLPERNGDTFYDDLVENPILLKGDQDGRFDKNDMIVFYGEGPHKWYKRGSSFKYVHNFYSDTNYYFLTFDGGSGTPKRINNRSSATGGVKNITVYNDFDVVESDLSNLISSGRMWFGQNFGIKNSHSFDFNFPNIVTTRQATVHISAALRSVNSASTLSAVAGGIGSGSLTGGTVSGDYTADFARIDSMDIVGNPASSKFGVTLSFAKAGGESNAWIDRVQVNCSRFLRFVGPQMAFRSLESEVGQSNVTYSLQDINSTVSIWDITDPRGAINQGFSISGSSLSFTCMGDTLREFVAFSEPNLTNPDMAFPIANQNLHAEAASLPVMVIISAPQFISNAEDIAKYHEEKDGLTVLITTPQKIYNEYSSGRQDVSAIKLFLRNIYDLGKIDTNKLLRYVLLFGDASYDYKYRISGNTNYVPIYQTPNSIRPTESLASDDYIGFLSPDYDGVLASGIMQVGVGRFPVKNAREAATAVDKVLNYNSKASMHAWRNRVTYVGDDQDGNIHMRDANQLADTVDRTYPQYNVSKIFLDAYPQRSTAGGQRYPDVNRAIDDAVQLGSLTINYIGHGGELGWAHERILEVSQINKWSNPNNMPLFVTATCEFSRFDDPKRTSAGEFVFLNPDGAGIGLLSTTRLVYSTPNKALAVAFNKVAYQEINGEMPRLGDIIRMTKANSTTLTNNSRVFALLGDPALKLNYPKEKIRTTSRPDTIGALQKVTISGEVIHHITGARMTGFNGTVYPLVYDKKSEIETLNNDGAGSFNFSSRNRVLFRGKASVSNGIFQFTFVVPKDIDLNYGLGKISYYAENGIFDAAGFDTLITVGGQVGDPSADQIGPQIDLFMNDSTFVNGGLTDQNPKIFAKFFDDNGINVSGNGIGHDLIAVVDEKTESEIVLNEYYESNLNSYQNGQVNYPLKGLSEGKHTLRVKAWDVYNNSGEEKIEFVVSSSATLALDHVLNYPNPFTTNTSFYFEHNYPDQDLFVRIQVFTISGRVVKTVDGHFNSTGFRIGPIKWDGLDDFGDKIGKGVYVYRVMVKAPTGEVADKFEKLVILN
ncbi:MAG: type IX secretion system sortase PorU [Flavobacteriales bacterium]|nr:type IX secretion system sortase PorU [Flavobacteriales bacterium]